jgi:hypothetical protein
MTLEVFPKHLEKPSKHPHILFKKSITEFSGGFVPIFTRGWGGRKGGSSDAHLPPTN